MGAQNTRSLGRTIKYLRVIVEDMYIIRYGEQTSFQGWSERRRRGAKILSRRGRNDERPEFGGEIETRDPRAVILAFYYRKPRPAQGGRDCEKSLTETAAVATHCVLLFPPAGSSRRHKEDESIGQLSVCIKQCRSHSVVQYSITIIYESRSKNLPKK